MMNLSFRKLTLVCFLFMVAFTIQAQKISFDDVVSVRVQNFGPIIENDQVKGYFAFYKIGKVDRKNRAYLLNILDENLNLVNKKKFTKSKHIQLTEAVYNNKAFLFSFLDPRKKILTLESYDMEMKKLGFRTYDLDRWALSQYQNNMSGTGDQMEEGSNKLIFPMGDNGFIRYNMTKNKKVGYELEFLSNDLKKGNSWTNSSDEKSKTMLFASFGDISEKYLASAIMIKPKMLSNKKTSFNLQLIDLENKKVVFDKPLASNKYKYSFMSAFIEEDQQNVIVFGEYYDLDGNIYKSRSKGIAALRYDMSGKLIAKEHHSWAGAVGKKVGVNEKGKITEGGYVAFHKVLKTSDGQFYAVGEMYKKTADGVGIAMAALGGNASLVKMVVKDMIVFDFNPDLSLNEVTIFDKRKSSVSLPQGSVFLPPTMLSNYIRLFNGFDYDFTQMSKDEATFFTTFSAIEKVDGKRRPYFGIIARTEGDDDYVLDKIDLKTEASNIFVNPAKPGYVLLTEYYRKEKKLESRLEKINY